MMQAIIGSGFETCHNKNMKVFFQYKKSETAYIQVTQRPTRRSRVYATLSKPSKASEEKLLFLALSHSSITDLVTSTLRECKFYFEVDFTVK